jgi:hypothetical protein
LAEVGDCYVGAAGDLCRDVSLYDWTWGSLVR